MSTITEFSRVRKNEYKFYTPLDPKKDLKAEQDYLCFNKVNCSLCKNEMASFPIRVHAKPENLRDKGMKSHARGVEFYTLACNEHNTDPEKPICSECSKTLPKTVKKDEAPAKKAHAKKAPAKKEETPAEEPARNPEINKLKDKSGLVPAKSQTIEWAVSKLHDDDLLKVYNAASTKHVTKIADRKNAEKKLVDLLTNLGWTYEQLYNVAKDVGAGVNLEVPQFVAPEVGKGKGKKKEEPKETPKPNLPPVPRKAEPEAPVDKPSRSQTPPKGTEAPTPSKNPKDQTGTKPEANNEMTDDQLICKALENIKKLIDSSADNQTSTEEFAKVMRIKTRQAVRLCTRLAQNEFIEMQDDSDGNGPFYYITITDKGKKCDGHEVKGLQLTGTPGRPAAYSGYQIYKKLDENPRRPGTSGFESWRKIVDGMTVEAYLVAGGRMQDLKWDLDRGWVELRKGEARIDSPVHQKKIVGNKAFMGCTIKKISKENPRSEGSKGHESWEKLKSGMTYEEYINAGGRYPDLQWDWERGWVEIKNNEGHVLKPERMKGRQDVETRNESEVLDLDLKPEVQDPKKNTPVKPAKESAKKTDPKSKKK